MIKIGITGSIGTGKSVVSSYFKNLGHLVISADQINYELLKEKEVIKNINKFLFNEESFIIDKKRVANLIFSNKEKKKELESYLHPLIIKRMNDIINKSDEKIVFLEIPLLYETNLTNLVDYVIVVYASEASQIKRIIKRDNIDESLAIKRIKSQMPLKDKMLKADYIINNDKTIEETNKELKHWYLNYYTRRL